MDRTLIIRLGVIAWAVAIADVIIHLAVGDLVVPVGMAAILVLWAATRGPILLLRARRAEADVIA